MVRLLSGHQSEDLKLIRILKDDPEDNPEFLSIN